MNLHPFFLLPVLLLLLLLTTIPPVTPTSIASNVFRLRRPLSRNSSPPPSPGFGGTGTPPSDQKGLSASQKGTGLGGGALLLGAAVVFGTRPSSVSHTGPGTRHDLHCALATPQQQHMCGDREHRLAIKTMEVSLNCGNEAFTPGSEVWKWVFKQAVWRRTFGNDFKENEQLWGAYMKQIRMFGRCCERNQAIPCHNRKYYDPEARERGW